MSEYVEFSDGTKVPYEEIVDNDGAFVDVLMKDEGGVKVVTECSQQKGKVTRFIISDINVWLPGTQSASKPLQVAFKKQKDG